LEVGSRKLEVGSIKTGVREKNRREGDQAKIVIYFGEVVESGFDSYGEILAKSTR